MPERSPPGVRGSCWADQSRYTVCVVRRTTENSWSSATNARSGFHGKCVVKRWPNYFCPDCTGKGSSPSTPVRARCFTLHSPHRAPTGAPYPGLPGPGYESHQSGTSGAGRPTRGGVFRPANGAASSPRPGARLYGPSAGSGSSDSDWSSLPESKGDACVYPSVPEPGRLDCLHRPKDAYHHVPIAAASRDLLGFYFQRKCLSLQGTALRAQARTSPFHEADRMRGRFSPSAGVAIFLLPRHCW